MKLACLSTGRLLEQRRTRLSAAEGLKLEEHLASCARCRADANLLDGLVTLSVETPATLSEAARERAIAGAFVAHAAPGSKRSAQRPARGPLLLVAAAAAIVCAWIAVRELGISSPVTAPNTVAERASPSRDASPTNAGTPAEIASLDAAAADRVLSGRVDASGTFLKTLRTGELLREHTRLRTTEGALLMLAHARVELRAGAEIDWNAKERRMSLPGGSAFIEVDETRHQSFEVETSSFLVAVLGTRFEVTQSSVTVLRGRVSVRLKSSPRDTPPLLLAADSDQTHFELPPTAATLPAAQQARAARAPHAAEAGAWLEQARAQLAARQLQQARNTLKLAKPWLRDDASRAQALSLAAECELQAHRFASARDSYLRVVRRFPRLPAAETALFAAARIETEHGQAQRAQQLLTSYLSKHPQGSFAREAALRLGQLQRGAAAEPAR